MGVLRITLDEGAGILAAMTIGPIAILLGLLAGVILVVVLVLVVFGILWLTKRKDE